MRCRRWLVAKGQANEALPGDRLRAGRGAAGVVMFLPRRVHAQAQYAPADPLDLHAAGHHGLHLLFRADPVALRARWRVRRPGRCARADAAGHQPLLAARRAAAVQGTVMKRIAPEWNHILVQCGVKPITAAIWSEVFAACVGANTFSADEEDLRNFLAQTLHETAMLERLEENLDYSAKRSP